jgi:hypothetical protein
MLEWSRRKDLPVLDVDIIPLLSGFLQKITREIVKLIERGKTLLLEKSDVRMGSRHLVNRLFLLTTSLIYM